MGLAIFLFDHQKYNRNLKRIYLKGFSNKNKEIVFFL